MSLDYLQSTELSDVGKKRKNNEDSCLRLPEKGMFCVADGMGGVAAGDMASEAITTTILEVYTKASPRDYATYNARVNLFKKAVNQASKWIKNFADEKVIGQMGSTVVGFLLDPHNPARGVALHAGDSRLYRYRDGKLEVLTADHTAVAALAAKLGRDPATLPAKYHNELLRAVGLKETVELEQTPVEIKGGDIFMLCSDGLSKMLTDEELANIFKRTGKDTIEASAKAFIDDTNNAGGKDNVTVVIVRIGDTSNFVPPPMPDEEPEAETTAGEASDETVERVASAIFGASEENVSASAEQGYTPMTHENPQTPTPHHEAVTPVIEAQTPSSKPRTEAPATPAQPPAPVAPAAPISAEPAKPITLSPSPAPVAQPQPKPAPVQQSPAPAPIAAKPAPAPAPKPAVVPATRPVAPMAPAAQPAPAKAPTPVIVKTSKNLDRPPVPWGRFGAIGAVVVVAVIILWSFLGPHKAKDLHLAALTNEPPTEVTAPTQPNTTPAPATNVAVVKISTPAPPPETHPTPPTPPVNVVTQVVAVTTPVTNVAPAPAPIPAPPPKPTTGTVSLASDPSGAEVWVGMRQKGVTPLKLTLPLGQQSLILRYPGLPPRELAVNVSADGSVETNVVFSYGSMVLVSEPSGASVSWNGTAVGQTPYTNAMLAAGPGSWSITAEGLEPTNVAVQIADHAQSLVNVTLQHGKGMLQLSANMTGVAAMVDGVNVGSLPAVVSVEAGMPHVIAAQQGNRWLTNEDVRVTRNQTRPLAFTFDEIAPVKVASTWTNAGGMVFVKVPDTAFWVATTRVTPQQYEEIVGRTLPDDSHGSEAGQDCVINLSYGDAMEFAQKLTDKQKGSGGFPPGCNQFALPNFGQCSTWLPSAEVLGIRIKGLGNYAEWCMSEDGQDLGCVRFDVKKSPFAVGSLSPPPAPTERVARPIMTVRLVTAP